MSQPIVFKIDRITQDSPILKTYVIKHNLRAKPGQLIMVWMPGVDEVPMSVGWQTEDEFHIGIADAGDCTHAMHERLKPGDRIGIRGPYGTSFKIPAAAKHIAVIGGGYGTPPLLLLAQEARAKNLQVTAILGARNKDLLIYENLFEKIGCRVLVSTDDGSKGHKGYNTNLLEKVLKEEKIDGVYTCGPEVMMVKVAKASVEKGVFGQVSLERYMKCGFGVCGQCCMDDSGLRVCKDGPVFNAEAALEHPEFGQYDRTASGKIHRR